MTQGSRLPLFYVITSFFWFSLYAYVPYVTPFGEEMGADMRLLGLIAGSYGFTQMVVRFPLGLLSDRLGKRKIFVLGGLLFAAVSGFVVFLFPSPGMLLLARALGGVAASSWVAFIVLNASYYPPEETAKSVGVLNSANSAGTMGALLIGGLAAQWLGVPYAFLLGGIAGLAALVMGLGIKERQRVEESPASWSSLLGIVRNRQLLFASALGIIIQYVRFASTFGFTPLIAVSLNATPFQLGMLGVVATLPGLIISPLAGTVLPRWLGIKGTLIGGLTLAGICCALIPFCQALWQLFVIQIIGNTGALAAFTLLMGLCIRDIPAERRATAMGFFQAAYGLGMFLGPFAMGWMGHSFGLTAAFVASGCVGLLAVVIVLIRKPSA
jgi:MFS family permease